MKLFDLTGKAAVVTGGNGGIGLGMARGLVEAGAAVLVVGRNEKKNDAAVRALRALGGKAEVFVADVTNETQCAAMVDACIGRFGRLDALFNNAGINIRKAPQDLALDEWRQVIDVNLTSAFLCSKAAYPTMKAAGGGKIVNTGSMLSIFGVRFAPAYGASKGGIVQLTKSLAAAWAADSIQVNAVLPGWIDTELTVRAREQVPELHDNVVRRTPAARWGRPDDHAGIAVFLASAASDFITGAAIPVDGGFSIQG